MILILKLDKNCIILKNLITEIIIKTIFIVEIHIMKFEIE